MIFLKFLHDFEYSTKEFIAGRFCNLSIKFPLFYSVELVYIGWALQEIGFNFRAVQRKGSVELFGSVYICINREIISY
jgi:hypothetical protein